MSAALSSPEWDGKVEVYIGSYAGCDAQTKNIAPTKLPVRRKENDWI